jgi:hypothetical protein
MIPKMNMKVVIPNMNILGLDEVKPRLLLKVIDCKRASSFLQRQKQNSQEDIDRGSVEYDVGAYGGVSGPGQAKASILSLTIYDTSKKVAVHCQLVLVVVRGNVGSITGHGDEME